jgi:DNA-binding response OmpR family regulator
MAQNPHAVLVVDDNPEVSTVVMLCLRSAGFRALQAEDGESGFQLALTEKPALILLDECMPRMNGQMMLAKLKESAITGRIPVIMIAGSGLTDEKEWQSRGAFGLLAKPFQFHELLSIVRKALSSHSFAQE